MHLSPLLTIRTALKLVFNVSISVHIGVFHHQRPQFDIYLRYISPTVQDMTEVNIILHQLLFLLVKLDSHAFKTSALC